MVRVVVRKKQSRVYKMKTRFWTRVQASLARDMTEVEILRSRNSFVALPRKLPENTRYTRLLMMPDEDEPELVVDIEAEQQTQLVQSNDSSVIENAIQQSAATEDEEDECSLDAIQVEDFQVVGQTEPNENQEEQVELAKSCSSNGTFNANDSGFEDRFEDAQKDIGDAHRNQVELELEDDPHVDDQSIRDAFEAIVNTINEMNVVNDSLTDSLAIAVHEVTKADSHSTVNGTSNEADEVSVTVTDEAASIVSTAPMQIDCIDSTQNDDEDSYQGEIESKPFGEQQCDENADHGHADSLGTSAEMTNNADNVEVLSTLSDKNLILGFQVGLNLSMDEIVYETQSQEIPVQPNITIPRGIVMLIDGSEASQLDGGDAQRDESDPKEGQNSASAHQGQEVMQPGEDDTDKISQPDGGIASITSKSSLPVNVREYNSPSTSVNICTDRPLPRIEEGKDIYD